MDADSKEMAAVAANDSIAPPLNAAANDSNAEAQDAQASGTQTPEQDPEKRPAVFRSTLSEILFITVCTLAIASSSLLAGSVTVISNAVGDDLHMDQAEVTWLFSGPSLACGSFVLMFGRLADLFGRKALFVGSIFLFAVFAMGGALSHSPIVIDTMGGLMGLASAAAVPPAVGSLGNTYPKPSKRKNYVFACFSAGNPLGFVFGTIASGIAALIFNWRASYWLLAIIYLFVTIMAFFTVPPDNTEKLPWNRETLKKFDFVGVLLGVAGLALTTASLTLGGSAPDGWRTGYVIALLVVGVAFLVTFVCYELRYPHPVMPMWIWRDRNFSVLNIVVMLGMSGFTSVLFWVSLYIQRFWTSSAIHVAAYVLPCAIMGTIANVVVGSIMHRFSNKIIFTVASFIYIIAFLLLAVNRDNFGYWPCIFPALMLVVWGADLQFCIANMYVISSMPLAQQSLAGGIFQTMSRLGSTIGSGISTAIYNEIFANPPVTGYYAYQKSAPYAGAYWYAFGAAIIAFGLCFALRLRTQGVAESVDGDKESDGHASSVHDEKAVQSTAVTAKDRGADAV